MIIMIRWIHSYLQTFHYQRLNHNKRHKQQAYQKIRHQSRNKHSKSPNPKKRTLQASPTTSTSTSTNKRRTNSESSTTSTDMNREMTQKETTIYSALHVADKIQLQNIPLTLIRSNNDRSTYTKKLTCRYIINEIQTRGTSASNYRLAKRTTQYSKLFLKNPRQAQSTHKDTLKQFHTLHPKTLTESLTHNETHTVKNFC